MTVSCRIVLRVRNVSDKSYRENQKKHFKLSIFFSENHAINEVTWKNMAEMGRPQ
jgi:hypothetical protein